MVTLEHSSSRQSNLNDVPLESVSACPVCGLSESQRLWTRARDILHRVTAREFTYQRCGNCRLVYLSPRPTAQGIVEFYPTNYEPHSAEYGEHPSNTDVRWLPAGVKVMVSLFKPLLRVVNQTVAKIVPETWPLGSHRLYSPAIPQSVLLDYGCGSGSFLKYALSQGWAEAIGLDFSPNAVTYARAQGLDVRLISPETWATIPDNSVDVIRLNHVFEHLYDPAETLNRLYQKLAPNGRIHLAVPNPQSLSARLFKANWRGLECPRHILLYPPKTLERVLIDAGYMDIRVHPEFLTKDAARSIGFFMASKGWLSPDEAEQCAHDKLLNTLLYFPIRLLLLFPQWADRIHVVARKPH